MRIRTGAPPTPPEPRRRVRAAGRAVAAGLVGVLGITLLQTPAWAEVDEQAREQRRPKTQTMESVPVAPILWDTFAVPSDDATKASRTATPKGVWPTAGTAVAQLPLATLRKQALTGRLTRSQAAVEGAAGSLPVRVSAPASVRSGLVSTRKATRTEAARTLASKVPGKVSVRVLDRASARRAGMDGPVLTLTRADSANPVGPAASAGKVAVEVDYSKFARAYGGDWASRLRLVQLPACALTNPAAANCAPGKALPTTNDAKSGTLTAEVTVPGTVKGVRATAAAATVLAVSAGSSGPNGSFAATPLTPAGTWQMAGNSGSFSWQYPLRVPPAVAGPSPQLSLSYNSGSVDGRTSSTSGQTSWVGEGFDLSQGYIERSYRSCKDDGHDEEGEEKYDQCWHSDNATMSFGGRNGELVKKSGADSSKTLDGNPDMKLEGTWRLKTDDGTKIERWSGGFNSGDSKEFWLVTTTDGTRYYFGRNKRTADDGEGVQDSAWQTPVYGDDSGEPCHGDTFKESRCNQTWRWNLDYVLDTHDNSMTLYWEKETNRYGANRDDVSVAYDRGGYLKRIEYGERKGTDQTSEAPARVVFGTAERCKAAAADCEPGDLKEDTAASWPDVPFDQICKDEDSCEEQWSPSFFSRKRLTSVTTEIRKSAGTYAPVDTWTLDQSYPDTGDGSTASLWLQSITHTGKANGATSEGLKTVFYGVKNNNRVYANTDGRLPMGKWRIRAIRSETGGVTSVTYKDTECKAGETRTPSSNTKLCFPSFWSEEGTIGEDEDWFHKYVVDTVTEDDATVPGVDTVTRYSYYGGAAWRYDDSEIAKAKKKTWSQFRGFRTVRTVTGDSTTQQLSAESTFLRGMDGDRANEDGGTEDVWTTASDGTRVEDADRLQSYLLETRTYSSVPADTAADRTAKEISGSVNTPWLSAATATEGSDKAQLTGTARVDTRTALDGSAVRRTAIVHDYDSYGMLLKSSDLGDVGADKANTDASDDSCTRYEYARNDAKTLLTLVKRVSTVAVNCDTAASLPGDAISDVRTVYDGLAYGAEPTQGEVSSSRRVTGYGTDGTPTLQTVGRTEYDIHGRVTASYDTKDNKTVTSYTPATGGPVTGMKVTTPPAATGGTGQSTASVVDPAFGLVTSTIDANSQRTDLSYDALGRLTKVWLPGHAKATDVPDTEYVYGIRADAPTYVTTKTLRANGNVTVAHALYDGLLRERQTQSPTPNTGRVLNLTEYDSRGLAIVQHGPFYNLDDPSTTLVDSSAAVGGTPPATETVYDGSGRSTATLFKVAGTTKWRGDRQYHGDHTTTIPPPGSTPSTTWNDAQGRTTKLVEYESADTSGVARTTNYDYDKAGRLEQVTDTTGKNVWKWTYDLLGRQKTAVDPDKGTTSMTYDEFDQVKTTTDALAQTLTYTYDNLGRTTKIANGTTVLNSWLYDTVSPNGIGRLTSTSSFSGGNEYKSTVESYDANGRPTKTTVTVPTAETGLAGSYTTTAEYRTDGTPKSMTLPAAANLASEKLSYGYNLAGQPVYSYGTTDYVRDTTYSNFGEPLQHTLGTSSAAKQTWLTNFYEEGTRRLARTRLDRESVTTPDADLNYVYDASGNVTKLADTPEGKTADVQCFQYDYLRRLTDAWTQTSTTCAKPTAGSTIGGPAPYWHQYAYDAAGNRTQETRNPVNPAAGGTSAQRVTSTYTPNTAGTFPVHALRSTAVKTETLNTAGAVTATTNTTDGYGYDAAGNTVARTKQASALGAAADQVLRYNSQGRLASTSKVGEKGQVTGLAGKCVDVQGSATAAGTPIQVYTCGTTDAQNWELTREGQLKALNVCAEPASSAQSAAVQVQPCDAADAAQKWTVRDDGGLRHTASGRCLDIPSSVTTDGTDLKLYDCNGTTAQRWVFAKHTSYVYDVSGQRLIRREYGKSTLYLGDTELTVDTKNTPATTDDVKAAVRYYTFGGATVAIRTSPTQVHWLGGGYNGTAEISVDATTQAVTQRRTTPFGQIRGPAGAIPGQKGFVGSTNDPGSGLVHMGARQYDPATGRFLTVDPVLDLTDPQHLNAYAYGRNNPIAFPDPTGLWWGWSDIGHAALDVVGLVPVFGEAADVINGAWYLAEGNYVDAALSFSSAIPLAGYAATAAKGAKYADEAIDAAKAVDKTVDAASDAKAATKAADEVVPPPAPKPKEAPKPEKPAKPKDEAGERGSGASSKKTTRKDANDQPTVVKGRDQKNVGVKDKGPESVTTGKRAGGDTVYAGHGTFGKNTKQMMVPQGTTLHFYIPHKRTLPDSVGTAVERGGAGAPDVVESFGPGSILPDYIISPPTNLNIMGGSRTVTEAVNISKVISQGMGDVHMAICRQFDPFEFTL
ncbi:ricin-type beta-trefoil lectin domain protein [Streptomyces geranii]|uniref:ricin-type beta-trefoil lectin domain protein n=1 Tax=Streptomyces geranii TaxID=2058923 RepID=UPI000D034423|nr:ricin-type beta-trefoil lectin domain protein [Streptomyces geranii]